MDKLRLEKAVVRLGCAENNPFLNDYYEKHGYEIAGKCSDGEYKGILRQKNITPQIKSQSIK